MGAMNVLMVRNYYNANIPYSIIEAAGMDGASDLRIYTSIIVPLSKPVLATIGLFAAIGYWNNWTNGLYYISDSNLYTIQVYLKRLMDNIAYLKSSNNMVEIASDRKCPYGDCHYRNHSDFAGVSIHPEAIGKGHGYRRRKRIKVRGKQ